MNKTVNRHRSLIILLSLPILISIESCFRDSPPGYPPEPEPRINFKEVNMVVAWQRHLELALNQDGDFQFSFTSKRAIEDHTLYYYLMLNSLDSLKAEILIKNQKDTGIGNYWAAPVVRGTLLNNTTGTGTMWSTLNTIGYLLRFTEANGSRQFQGPWAGIPDQYAAIRFKMAGSFRYGWIKLNHPSGEDQMLLESFAFNKNAGQAIYAGQQ